MYLCVCVCISFFLNGKPRRLLAEPPLAYKEKLFGLSIKTLRLLFYIFLRGAVITLTYVQDTVHT